MREGERDAILDRQLEGVDRARESDVRFSLGEFAGLIVPSEHAKPVNRPMEQRKWECDLDGEGMEGGTEGVELLRLLVLMERLGASQRKQQVCRASWIFAEMVWLIVQS